MKTRLISLFLAAATLLGTLGCGAGSPTPLATPTPTPVSTPAPTPTPAPLLTAEEKAQVQTLQDAVLNDVTVDPQTNADNGTLGSGFRASYKKLPTGTIPPCTGGAVVKGFTFTVVATATNKEVLKVSIATRRTKNGASLTWFNDNVCADSAGVGNAAVDKLAAFLRDSANLSDAQAKSLATSLLAIFFVIILFS